MKEKREKEQKSVEISININIKDGNATFLYCYCSDKHTVKLVQVNICLSFPMQTDLKQRDGLSPPLLNFALPLGRCRKTRWE
jgi:hypothetical protein